MALVAFHNRVRAQQREPVEVVFDRLHRNIPARGSVALGAVCAHLTAVKIRVAVRTIFAHVREDCFHVAVRAAHFFMHSAKRIGSGVVIEFRKSANRVPTGVCMAVLARNRKGAVRASRGRPLSLYRASRSKS